MKVLVADALSKEGIDIMKAVAEVDIKTGLKEDELIAIIGNYEGLVVRSQTQVTAPIIEAGKKLIIIFFFKKGTTFFSENSISTNFTIFKNFFYKC